MDEDKQREIASKGGKAAHEKGTPHEFDSEEVQEAGSKRGQSRSASNDSSRFGSCSKDDEAESGSGSTRGGSSEQHVEANRQSNKNK